MDPSYGQASAAPQQGFGLLSVRGFVSRHLKTALLAATGLLPLGATAQQIPTSPPVGFTNSTSVRPGTVVPRVLDSFVGLMTANPAVMTQNYQTVVQMTQARTEDQALAAIDDDRIGQAYSILNGLGPLTAAYLTGAGASSPAPGRRV
ncbi:hypothetical protein ASF60_22260 [Methylobacterium sp. Leaf113]|nr:hypothetical protein ASF60_22260 [Methylobacterium sp. Leaf113]